jgi:hypothetical protein
MAPLRASSCSMRFTHVPPIRLNTSVHYCQAERSVLAAWVLSAEHDCALFHNRASHLPCLSNNFLEVGYDEME